jgi:hypothetical protein
MHALLAGLARLHGFVHHRGDGVRGFRRGHDAFRRANSVPASKTFVW